MFFISQPHQHKLKHKNTLKAYKKEAVKTIYVIGHANNALYRYNKRHYNMHGRCTLNRNNLCKKWKMSAIER